MSSKGAIGSLTYFKTYVLLDSANSDVVVITAGVARKPGMSRDDLVQVNEAVMHDVTKEIVKYSPNCKIIVLTNPVDAMTYSVLQASDPKERVIGQWGIRYS